VNQLLRKESIAGFQKKNKSFNTATYFRKKRKNINSWFPFPPRISYCSESLSVLSASENRGFNKETVNQPVRSDDEGSDFPEDLSDLSELGLGLNSSSRTVEKCKSPGKLALPFSPGFISSFPSEWFHRPSNF